MVVEVSGADITPAQTKAIEVDDTSLPVMGSKTSDSEQVAEEPIVLGLVDSSQGVNGEIKEIVHAAAANFPKDAVDEWPAPKKIHTFYFARIRTYENPELKAKIEQTDKEIQKKNQARFQIIEALRRKRSERSNVISQLKPLKSEDRQYRTVIDEKRKEIEPLYNALGKMRDVNNAAKSEEELNKRIQSLNYRMQHESNTLVEEKQLLKEIKQLEGTREKVIANLATKAKIQDSQSQKEAIRDQVKLIGVDMDELRKDQQSIRTKIKPLEEELNAITEEIMSLEEDLEVLTKERDETYTAFNELRKARDEVNALFYQNRSLLNNAKELAAKKDIAALQALSHNEVEKFMSQWSNNKAFRDDYERRIWSSLDSRQLSRDGRMRNPDEKPIIEQRPTNNSETSIKISAKRADDAPPPSQNDIVSTQKAADEIIKPTELKSRGKTSRTGDIEDTDEIGKSKELPKPNDIDVAKLKELKREEEIAKAKLAMERKRKLAEKAAAKAAARAQKEAEKRMKKEKEKQAKKKAGVPEPPAPVKHTEEDTKIAELEEAEPKLEAPIPADAKDKKEKARYRGRPKVPAPLPKVILKRKKSHLYWSWAIPAAVFLAVVVVVAGYFYVARN